MSLYYKDLLEHYEKCWYEIQPIHTHPIANNSQALSDKALVNFKSDMMKLLRATTAGKVSLEDQGVQAEIKSKVIGFMNKQLGLDEWVCRTLDDEGYYTSTVAFYERAKATCPDLTFADINQALRNMWVIMALQMYMGEKIELTNAAFAYSMLYPLTDNYMDNPKIGKEVKFSFNKRFKDKIETGIAPSENLDEAMIFHMIDLIATDYNREDHPDVFRSLLAILHAQNMSLDQHDLMHPFAINLLRHTFYKGGTSVLADAYLVKGTLTEKEALFAFGYGVALQLADDFEDISSDILSDHATMPVVQSQFGPLDMLFDHYSAFFDIILEEVMETTSKKQEAMQALLSMSKTYLLLNNVYNNESKFGRLYFKRYSKNARFSKQAFLKHNKKIGHLIKAATV